MGLGAVLANKIGKNNGNYQQLKTPKNSGNDTMNDEEYEQRKREKLRKQ